MKSLEMVCEECTISRHDLLRFVVRQWISPADPERHCFDEEDVARIRLILLLSEDLEVGEEAIPIVLDLLDQLHVLRKALKDSVESS